MPHSIIAGMKHVKFVFLGVGLSFVSGATAQVVLNEVCVSNLNGLTVTNPIDGSAEQEDWVELFNTTGAAVNIAGWYLSDDPVLPNKWAFPAGASVPANGRLVVLCSAWNGFFGGYYSTNFKLNQTSADQVILSDGSATPVDSYQLNLRTMVDQSRGRVPDGSGSWSLIATPTPWRC
ncbi:MAG: lamin tail domain-containing protein [Flavobacteriales bacterium]|nr:lamin tail domain-containing protein [Flavobacteriales bacterium]